MTLTLNLDQDIMKMYLHIKSRLSKLEPEQDRQTDATDVLTLHIHGW